CEFRQSNPNDFNLPIGQECIYACIPQIIPYTNTLYQIPLLRVYRKHDRSLQATILSLPYKPSVFNGNLQITCL
ncbi:hypothetical protein L9F63_004912, partial [Diploptera punctata]